MASGSHLWVGEALQAWSEGEEGASVSGKEAAGGQGTPHQEDPTGRPTQTLSGRSCPAEGPAEHTRLQGHRDPTDQLSKEGTRAHPTLLSSSILRIRYGLLEEFSK